MMSNSSKYDIHYFRFKVNSPPKKKILEKLQCNFGILLHAWINNPSLLRNSNLNSSISERRKIRKRWMRTSTILKTFLFSMMYAGKLTEFLLFQGHNPKEKPPFLNL